MLGDWVAAGGDLIAMRPDKQLAGLLGLTDTGTTLANAYMRVDASRQPGAGIVSQTMQFHGAADRYALNGATSVADLYSSASAATTAPAVTMRSVGANGGARRGVHLRPRQVGRLHAPGQPGVGRPGARRGRPDPLRRPLLRSRAVRPAAQLGGPEQGRDPPGRRAAAPARQPHRGPDRRQEAPAALLVLPARRQGRGDHDRRRPRAGRHGGALEPVHLREPGRMLRRPVGVHPRHVVSLSQLTADRCAGGELRGAGIRGQRARQHELRGLHASSSSTASSRTSSSTSTPSTRASRGRSRTARTASRTATGPRRRRWSSRTGCGSTATTTTGRPHGS